MNQLATKPQTELILVVLSGPDRGSQYKLVGSRVSIGRNSDNDISIKADQKMSRNHAVLQINGGQVEIVNLSDRNSLSVNGQETSRAALTNGSIVVLGETKLQLKIQAPHSLVESPTAAITPNHPFSVLTGGLAKPSAPKSRTRRPKGFYILLAGIILIAVWLMTTKKNSKTEVEIRTDVKIDDQIKDFRKITDEIEAEKNRQGMTSRQYEEAQLNYVKGFRDYRKAQYKRAIESFRACLSLFPNHIQCRRYYDLASKKYDELIQYHMVLANKYRNQNQFDACKASYRNAMVMIGQPEHKTYLEAKAGFDLCKALEGDRF